MNTSFEEINCAALKWLYILEVEKKLGVAHPEIEHQINSSRFSTFDEFVDVLKSTNHRFTARCISRIFNYDLDVFSRLLKALSSHKKLNLYRLAVKEGRFGGAFFTDKLTMLKQQTKN